MFGVILPSRPVLGPGAIQTLGAGKFAFSIPAFPAFSHLVAFLLPEHSLPPDVLAGIYIQFPSSGGVQNPAIAGASPDFQLLGALSTNKQSAIFRVSAPRTATAASGQGQIVGEVGGMAEVDMDADEAEGNKAPSGIVTLGISVEPASTLQPQLDALLLRQQQTRGTASTTVGGSMVGAHGTKVLAQKIIKNAFNYLSGFAGSDNKVSLKSFEEWWRKFESRFDSDPTFLERLEGG